MGAARCRTPSKRRVGSEGSAAGLTIPILEVRAETAIRRSCNHSFWTHTTLPGGKRWALLNFRTGALQ